DGYVRRPLAQTALELGADVFDPDRRRVPLRQDDERRVLRLARDVGDREVLVDEPLRRVDEDQCDVRPLSGLERAQLGVVLDSLPMPALAADAGGVDQDEGRSPRRKTVSIASRVVPGVSDT